MGFALSTTFRGDFRTLLWLTLATLALGWLAASEVRAQGQLGLEVAADEVRVTLDEMADALNAARREVQLTIGADLHLMSQAITRALGRLEDGAVPIVDPTLVYDLNLLADVAAAASRELQAAAAENGGSPATDRIARIEALADAAAARLLEVNLVIDGWTERGRNAVVELAEVDGALVVRTTDRLIYNGVRYASIGLLLVGLLVVGLQLLRMSEDRVDSLALLRETPVLSGLAIVALILFFVGCVAFSLHPGTLAALSAEVRQQPQEHPCERLAEQRERLIAVQQVEHRGLVEATKARMAPAARDCLGLPSETATAEAIDLLAAKTAVARYEPLRSPASDALAAAEPQEPASDVDSVVLPASPAPADPTQTAEFEALADLARQIRDAEAALSVRLDDAVAEELEQAGGADVPAFGPEPAAGPAFSAGTAASAAEVGTTAEAEPAAEAAAVDAETGEVVAGPAPPAPESEPVAADALDGGAPELYVTTTAVNYRAGPSLAARRLGTFVPGARLAVVGENEGWSEVRLGDGREVFVASEFLELAP